MSGFSRRRAVLVPFDFGEAAVDALGVAREFVEDLAHLDVVCVIARPSPAAPAVVWGDLKVEDLRETARGNLDEALAAAGCSGCTPHILVGSPAKRLVEFAKERGSDLVVMPSHGRKGVARWMLGSVSEHVVREVPCPVLVLRSEPDAPAG